MNKKTGERFFRSLLATVRSQNNFGQPILITRQNKMYRLTVAGRYTVQFEMIRLDDITCLAVARVTIPWTVLPSSTFKKKKNESRNPITVKRILWRDRPLRYHSTILLISGLLSLGLLSGHASAQSVRDTSDNGQEQAVQDSFATADSFARRHVVQLSPHVLLFNPQTQSATLEFHNPTDSVERAQVQVQFALLDYRPRGLPGDSIIIDPNGPSMPHDTVIAHPGPTDHFAGRWLSGVPTTITLAPHATKRVTLRLTPPPKLPAGEYWARIQTIIPISPRRGGAQDMRQRYALPTPVRVPLLRDTCLVLYRQGPLHMGLAIGSGAIARLDSADIGGVNNEYVWKHALWIRLPLHLTGNVPFRGMMHSQFRNLHDGEELNRNQQELLLMRDVVLHIEVETYKLGPGQYEYDIWFDNERTDLSPTERLSMPPVRKAFRFEVLPAWAY